MIERDDKQNGTVMAGVHPIWKRSVGRMVGWKSGWLEEQLVGIMVGRKNSWLEEWLVGRMVS